MPLKIVDLSLRDIKVASVCIVRFNAPIGPSDVKAGLFFQVVVDPEKVKGDFIRFGDFANGDELVGWQPLDFLRIVHVLAERRPELNDEGAIVWDNAEESNLGVTIT